MDTAYCGNFTNESFWKEIGEPPLQQPKWRYESTSKHDIPALEMFVASTRLLQSNKKFDIPLIVSKVLDLNLLERNAAYLMGISVDDVFHSMANDRDSHAVNAVFNDLEQDRALQEKCHKLCDEFPDLWNTEMGCLKDIELEVNFKAEAVCFLLTKASSIYSP